MYQSGRVRDEAKKHKSPAKSGRVGIFELIKHPGIKLNQTIEFNRLI